MSEHDLIRDFYEDDIIFTPTSRNHEEYIMRKTGLTDEELKTVSRAVDATGVSDMSPIALAVAGTVLQMRITEAVRIARDHLCDGEHHKMWVIDQMVRTLLGPEEYEKFVKDYEGDGEYFWDEGIAP